MNPTPTASSAHPRRAVVRRIVSAASIALVLLLFIVLRLTASAPAVASTDEGTPLFVVTSATFTPVTLSTDAGFTDDASDVFAESSATTSDDDDDDDGDDDNGDDDNGDDDNGDAECRCVLVDDNGGPRRMRERFVDAQTITLIK